MKFDFATRGRPVGARAALLAVGSGAGCWPPRPRRPIKATPPGCWSPSALVLMMSIPGLALFYGGLVRTKNMLSMLSQVFAIVCLVVDLGPLRLFARLHATAAASTTSSAASPRPFCRGMTPTSVPTFSNGVVIPELLYVPDDLRHDHPALIVGALAERMKFSAVLVFILLWVTFIYFPIAHMVWYWAGPDAIGAAAKALADAPDDAAKAAAQANLDAVLTDAGLFSRWGALDFAGGTVVHINAGIAGFVGFS